MITSEQINEYAKAMATAQGQIKNPSKSKTNPHFKSTYADLADGIDATRDAFSANGLCIIQSTSLDGELLVLETRIVHSSGQWVSGTYPVCKLPNTPQNIGSAMTYARRFSLFGLANIAGDDDDGAEANKTETPAPPKKPVSIQNTVSVLSDDQFKDLVETGDARALAGIAALQTFWKGLENAERVDLGPERLAAWKAIAAKTNQSSNQEKEAA